MSSRIVVSGTILAFVILTILTYPAKPTLRFEVATEPVATLLPHAHGIQNKISDAAHGVDVVSIPVEVPETMWVSHISFEALHAPQGVIHHLNIVRLRPGETEEEAKQSVIATIGQDTIPSLQFPAPAGIVVNKGDRLMIVATLHNPVPPLGEGGVYKDVVVKATLEGFRSGEGRYVPLYTNYVLISDSLTPEEDDRTFEVPVGTEPFTRSSVENAPGVLGATHRFPEDGWIVYLGAHLHAWEGGKRVDAYINGARVLTFTSKLLDAHIPWSFQTGTPGIIRHVHAGDVLTTSATYVSMMNPLKELWVW